MHRVSRSVAMWYVLTVGACAEYNGEDSVFSQPNYNDTEEPDNAVIPTAEDPPSLSVDQRLPFPSSVEASDELTEVERALKEAGEH